MIKEQSGGRSEGRLRRRRELYLVRIVEALPPDLAGFRKFRKNEFEKFRIEKIIEYDVRERFRIEIGRVCRFLQSVHPR